MYNIKLFDYLRVKTIRDFINLIRSYTYLYFIITFIYYPAIIILLLYLILLLAFNMIPVVSCEETLPLPNHLVFCRVDGELKLVNTINGYYIPYTTFTPKGDSLTTYVILDSNNKICPLDNLKNRVYFVPSVFRPAETIVDPIFGPRIREVPFTQNRAFHTALSTELITTYTQTSIAGIKSIQLMYANNYFDCDLIPNKLKIAEQCIPSDIYDHPLWIKQFIDVAHLVVPYNHHEVALLNLGHLGTLEAGLETVYYAKVHNLTHYDPITRAYFQDFERGLQRAYILAYLEVFESKNVSGGLKTCLLRFSPVILMSIAIFYDLK